MGYYCAWFAGFSTKNDKPETQIAALSRAAGQTKIILSREDLLSM